MPETFTHVIFDLDGTLLNTLEDLADACNWLCQRHGWPVHTLEEYRYFVGNGAAKLVERSIPDHVQVQDTLVEEFTRQYNAHKADKTRPYDGIKTVLDQLKQQGISLAVLTNKPDSAAGSVVEQYFPGVFPLVRGGRPGVPLKPDPTPVFDLMRAMGADSAHTLFVGDSNVDIQTAKNSGISACGVLWGFRTRQELEEEGAEFIAPVPEDLLNIILGER